MVVGNSSELAEFANPLKVSQGDKVYFVRKISGDVIEATITDWLPGNKCRIAAEWRHSYKFTLHVLENLIVFDTGKKDARLVYKNWYVIWEPQRQAFLAAFRDPKLR